MKSYRKELQFPLSAALVNITRRVEECVRESGVQEGLVLAHANYVWASVIIHDGRLEYVEGYFTRWLEQLAPNDGDDAYLKQRQIMGREVVVAITNRKLDLGTLENIYYGQLYKGSTTRDGRVLVKIIGE